MIRTLGSTIVALLAAVVLVAPAGAEKAGSSTRAFQAGLIDAGVSHTCVILATGNVRCWGVGSSGLLGYGNSTTIGDDETPGSAGPVTLGSGRTARAISIGYSHTCAVLDDGAVRCWGDGDSGKLGYANTSTIGDDETPGSVGPVDLGTGRTAVAIAAGNGHSCAILDTGAVRCWGFNQDGQLGLGNTTNIGDNETPASVGTVDLGAGRTATAIAAGQQHTCAILDTGAVRCWGWGASGRLGYGNTNNIGDNETPGSVGTVDLGAGRTAVAITAGYYHTCAILDDGSVRCWGLGSAGRLGYGNTNTIGDDETPGSVGTVDIGAGRTAVAISATVDHVCVVLDNGSVRCWGLGSAGRLGYGNTNTIGDDETPGSVGTVDLGVGRTASAISVGGTDVPSSTGHSCALLDTGDLTCWGTGLNGRLGYGNTSNIGDNETPASAGTLSLGGSLIGSIADVSVGVGAGSASAVAGSDVTLTVTVSNAGLDAAQAPVVDVAISGAHTLVSNAPSTGSFDAGSGDWQPGAIPSGQSRTLTLVVRPTQAGSLIATAELASVGTYDPDSVAGNAAAGEDDRASATVTVSEAPVTPPPPTPPPAAPPADPPAPPADSRFLPRLTLRLVADDGDAAGGPLQLVARGVLAMPVALRATGCRGQVKLVVKAGQRVLRRSTARLKLEGGVCRYTATLTFGQRARRAASVVNVVASFIGNEETRPASSPTRTAPLA